MYRFLLGMLLLLPASVTFAQEPEPAKEGPEVKGDPVPEGRVRLVRETGGHTGKPIAAVFTPDSKKVVSVGEDRTVQVWDVASTERLRVFHLPMGTDGNGGVVVFGKTLVVDRQGERVAFCVRAKDKVQERVRWNYATGYFEKTTEKNWSEQTPGATFAFVEVRRTDELIELFDKKRNNTIILYQDRCTIKRPKDADFSRLYGGNWDRMATFVCSLTTGQVQVLKRVGPREFSADGKFLAVGAGMAVQLVDITTDTVFRESARLPGAVASVVRSPDGKTLAVVAQDARVHLLDAGTLKLLHSWPIPAAASVRNVTWADDQTLVCRCSSEETTLVVMDANTGNEKHSYAFAEVWQELPKGTRHGIEVDAIAGTTQAFVKCWHYAESAWPYGGFVFNWATGKAGKGFTQHAYRPSYAAAIAPDQSVAVQGNGEYNLLVLWNPKDGKPFMNGKAKRNLATRFPGAKGDTSSVRWYADQTVTGYQFGSSPFEMDLFTLTRKSISRDEFQKSGTKMADLIRGDGPPESPHHIYERGILRKWGQLSMVRKDSGYEISGGPQLVPVQVWNPIYWDNTFVAEGRIVCPSFGSPYLQVFDSATGKRLHATRVTTSDVICLAVSPDRRYVVAGSLDQTLAIFNPATGKLLLTVFSTGQDWIAWTPEGYYAGTPGGERLMGWHVDNGPDQLASFYPAERFRKQFYRPDVIKLLLKTGSVAEALKSADAALGRETRDVKFDDVLPPSVQLTLVEQNKSSLKLRVRAEAQAAQQPIASMRLFLDGRPVQGKETFAEFPAGKQQTEVDWTFELPEGEHQLTVLVRGPDSSSVSPPLRLKHAELKKLPTLHVLTIGINDYQDNSLDLKFAAPDATALAAAFGKHCKGQAFADVKTRTLLNKDATAKAILRELADMRKDTKQEDLAVVFFACHGVKQKEGYFLLTHEADVASLGDSALSGEVLRKSLGEFKCQVLLMLDACHSAGFGAGKKLTNLGLKPATDDVARDLTEDDVGIAVLCAAMGHEKAEGVDGHGLFTQAVLEVLAKKPGVPQHPRNRHVYVHHLHTYVFDHVSDRSDDRQHPFLSLPWVVESFVVR